MKISYLGPKGTFSYEVCKKYYPKDEMIEAKTIIDAVEMLENALVDKAIVPIENSLQGGVSETIDTIILYDDICVSQELILDISQNLMSKNNLSINEIEAIYSHSQAISQSREYLKKHNLYDKTVAVESTAKAAQIVAESSKKVACIGSIACIEEYELTLLCKDIQDNNSNQTKFWVLEKNSLDESDFNNELKHKKMSMVFSVKNKPGALFEVLKLFKDYDLNLTKIESRPAKTTLGEYIFLIDVEINDLTYKKALNDIKDKNIFYRILGIYNY